MSHGNVVCAATRSDGTVDKSIFAICFSYLFSSTILIFMHLLVKVWRDSLHIAGGRKLFSGVGVSVILLDILLRDRNIEILK